MKPLGVKVENVVDTIKKIADKGARLITINCEDHGDNFELMYFFDPRGDAEVQTVKTTVKKGGKAPSISDVYAYAAIIESEFSELFGLPFEIKGKVVSHPLLLAEDSPKETLLKTYPTVVHPLVRKVPKCIQECPISLDIPSYIRHIEEENYLEALKVIKSKLPIPAIIGRICPAFCEEKCRRYDRGGALSSRLLKRCAADFGYELYKEEPPKIETGKKVAIIGGGPAGITAAYFLRKLGHLVTIFEERPRLGGMMRLIPKFRLPRKIMDSEIKQCCSIGIEVKTNTPVRYLDELFNQGFNAIFVGNGAQKSSRLGIPGEDNPRVIGALEFLRAVHDENKKIEVGDNVYVIGGGNVAMDAARTALRLGAKKVHLCYRRTKEEMPASQFELEEAELEGTECMLLSNPTRVIESPNGIKVEFVRMELGAPDASGRRRVEPKPGSEFQLEVNTLITAIGYGPNIPPEYKLNLSKGGYIIADQETLKTSREGVFAAGDIVTGPNSVIHACAGGRRAAHYIDKYLGGKGIPDFDKWDMTVIIQKPVKTEELERAKRIESEFMANDARIKSFDEVEYGFGRKCAVKEAERCYNCDWNE